MLLVIDAGNSSISLGLFETPDVGAPDGNTPGGRPTLLWTVKIAADPQRSADEYRLTLGLLLRDGGYSPADVDAVALGSVVPALTHTLREALGRLCRRSDGTPVPLRTVSAGTRTGLVLQIDDPAQLGADIVTGAAAAVWLYGTPVAVLDFGTATVLSCVDANRTLLGVSIAPGMQTSLDGLRGAAALIPHVELRAPENVLGRNTADSVRAGVVYGTAAMADGLVEHPADRSVLRHPLLPPPDAPGGRTDVIRAVPRLCADCPARGTAKEVRRSAILLFSIPMTAFGDRFLSHRKMIINFTRRTRMGR